MNNLAGDPGVDGDGPDVESKLDALSEGYVPSAAPNPAKVTSQPLPITAVGGQTYDERVRAYGVQPVEAVGHLLGNDEHASGNLEAERQALYGNNNVVNTSAYMKSGDAGRYAMRSGQGPAKLNSQDASAPDARGGANTTSDTSNTPPGTQDASQSASSPYWNAPVAPNGMSTSFADISGGDLTKGGIAAAIAATLSKRYKPSMGQSIHLGNVHAPQAASQYVGSITPATAEEMVKAKSKPSNNVRSRTAKRKKKDDE